MCMVNFIKTFMNKWKLIIFIQNFVSELKKKEEEEYNERRIKLHKI